MKILVVFTGGTIGSTKNNGVISPDKSNSYLLLDLYRKLDEQTEFVSVQPYTILSENLCGDNLNQLYDCICKNITTDTDGVIVTHGTDTLQYTSAFLSYAFGLNSIPIVVVSANYPLADERSNGFANFASAVDFIRENAGSGVFTAYKNEGENPKIHRASRLIAHRCYDDNVFSVFNSFYGEIVEHNFVKNPVYSQLDDKINMNQNIKLGKSSDIIRVNPCVGMEYPVVSDKIKAILLEGYHSGTLNTISQDFIDFCKGADDKNVPIFLTGACKGFYYESKLMYEKLKINVLPPASPIAMYQKLWMLNKRLTNDIMLPCGGDILNNI